MRKFLWLFLAVLLVGCSTGASQVRVVTTTPAPTTASSPLQEVFRNTAGISGWATTSEARVYNPNNLFDLVDGQAEAFFAYNFRQVAVQRYQNGDARLDAEVWQLASPADAYGLFTASATGPSASIGNEGDTEPGRRVSFWQECYVAHISARQKIDDAILMNFARAISQALPNGGERPALVGRLPQTGLKGRGFIFFRKELSIQDQVWLGGKNILGLSETTHGVLARYEVRGQTARLLLVEYPASDQASAGLQALQSGKVTNLVSVQAQGNVLGAVFGKVDTEAAKQLLTEALKN